MTRTPEEVEALRANLREAWSALAMIREAVETLGPVGAMPASEHLEGPTFTHEAEAIVAGIRRMAEQGWQPMETAPKDQYVDLWSPTTERHTKAFYSANEYCPGIAYGWGSHRLGRITDATHWRPLPAAPTAGRKG